MEKTERVLDILKKLGLDGIYLTKESNVNYISGFTDEQATVVICKAGNYIITDGRFTELAQRVCKGFEVVNWHLYDRDKNKAIENICLKADIKKLGFEESNLTFDRYTILEHTLSKHEIELKAVQNVIEKLRYVKDEEEISCIKKACEIADKALEELVPFIKTGVTEMELCARLEFNMKMNGAQALGFETILISGTKTSLPHGKPDEKRIAYGDFVTIDFGAMYKGYISDMTRTFVVGEADEKQIEVYNLVKRAQATGLQYMKAGAHATKPDEEIRKIISKYEEFYYPGIGHGVGRDLHEEPFLGNYGDRTMETGCVITMEPGIYMPNWGGVRIEDTVLITEDGIEILTKFPKELIILKED